ncbi:hypothetical protein PROFUN_10125 [Planoprotostelium fungivorum]|uniref:dCMP deaminase n=1 Tax=Planoprotostelium fungivorum TaxID=1890364 RepID=A0A2P6NES8_9EUKA|nr:hypothetical protein PROFUN_10125 [Planoprotostelium fungivorum]
MDYPTFKLVRTSMSRLDFGGEISTQSHKACAEHTNAYKYFAQDLQTEHRRRAFSESQSEFPILLTRDQMLNGGLVGKVPTCPKDNLRESDYETKRSPGEQVNEPDLTWDKRLDTNTFSMGVAELMRRKSPDPVTKVGCCILDGHSGRILSASYNGLVAGLYTQPNTWAKNKDNYLQHAERNALNLQPNEFNHCNDIVVYTTMIPCIKCAAMLMQHSTQQIIYNVAAKKYYEESKPAFDQAQIGCISLGNLYDDALGYITLKPYGKHRDPGFEKVVKLEVAEKVQKATITKWSEIHMSVAMLAAKRCNQGIDPSVRSGCCIVEKHTEKILSCGFTGLPKQLKFEKPNEKMIISAIGNALRFAGDVQGSTIYCIRSPTMHDIIECCQRGVAKVYCFDDIPEAMHRLVSEHPICLRTFDTKETGNYYEDIGWKGQSSIIQMPTEEERKCEWVQYCKDQQDLNQKWRENNGCVAEDQIHLLLSDKLAFKNCAFLSPTLTKADHKKQQRRGTKMICRKDLGPEQDTTQEVSVCTDKSHKIDSGYNLNRAQEASKQRAGTVLPVCCSQSAQR